MNKQKQAERIARRLIEAVISEGMEPPFTITAASPKGTVWTIEVAQDQSTSVRLEKRDPKDVDVDLLEGLYHVELGKRPSN